MNFATILLLTLGACAATFTSAETEDFLEFKAAPRADDECLDDEAGNNPCLSENLRSALGLTAFGYGAFKVRLLDQHWCMKGSESEAECNSRTVAGDWRRTCNWVELVHTLADPDRFGNFTCGQSDMTNSMTVGQFSGLLAQVPEEVFVPRGNVMGECFMHSNSKEACESYVGTNTTDNPCMYCEWDAYWSNAWGNKGCLQKSIMKYLCPNLRAGPVTL